MSDGCFGVSERIMSFAYFCYVLSGSSVLMGSIGSTSKGKDYIVLAFCITFLVCVCFGVGSENDLIIKR